MGLLSDVAIVLSEVALTAILFVLFRRVSLTLALVATLARLAIPGGNIRNIALNAAFLAADAGEFDLVHNHAGIEGLVLAATSRTPVITTTHNPWVEATRPVWDAYPWFHHAVSRASAATFPARGALPPIHHGIDVESYAFADHPSDGPLLFLGRFSPMKGADRAIDAALGAGRRLILAGKIDARDEAFVAERILPRIDGDRIRYVGEADFETKRQLLAEASALLFPIAWDEPFGLVMVEALSAGTPVIGFRCASVPEVIEHGRTGFVVDDVEGMVEAIGRIGEISRRACRAEAEERFTVARMVDDVEAMYRSVLERAGVLAGLTG
jgi:glycosyltransferase involved in cell wall biosynthesis